jgi:hypothetical protein
MGIVSIPQVGAVGVNKDLSVHELPPNAWTDAKNIRFLDGLVQQFLGHNEVYNSPPAVPQYLMPCNVGGARYWIYPTAAKTYCVTNTGGTAVHTDITHVTPRTGVVNQWTGTLLSGIPILNSGDLISVPMSWDLNTTHKFVDLANWPASTYCKAMRSYKNYLVALNVTKSGTNYPYMVKWSHPADPGTLPASWDQTDPTKDAGELDVAEGSDPIVDGLQLRDSFMIYKEASVWRMDFVGGPYVFRFSKVLGMSGALNRNCIVEVDGWHLVLTSSDVMLHDGQNAVSVLDKQTRRFLFQNIDVNNAALCFVYKNPFFNEVYICYPAIDATSCTKAMVWNYKDKTVSFRDMPNVNHGAFGPVDNGLASTWDGDAAPWNSDLTVWDGPDFVPSTARTMVASNDQKLYLMDASASFNGALPGSYLERRGLSFDKPERIKTVRGIRPRITGLVGSTVNIKVGSSPDPYADPVYSAPIAYTIGGQPNADFLVSGRYIAVRFETGSAYQWRLDSYDIDIVDGGAW